MNGDWYICEDHARNFVAVNLGLGPGRQLHALKIPHFMTGQAQYSSFEKTETSDEDLEKIKAVIRSSEVVFPLFGRGKMQDEIYADCCEFYGLPKGEEQE